MIANTVQHHEENDEELEDIEALRRIAMESIKKKAKEEQQQQNSYQMFHSQPSTAEINFQPSQAFSSHSFPSARPPRMHYARPRYGGPPQNLMNYPAAHNVPFHPRTQPIIHQDFAPIPHVNPQFMAQPQIYPPTDYQPPIGMDYIPTPAVRLSPRSLEFVESNKKALMNATSKKRSRSKSPISRRRYSRESRSRSRSPVKRRSSRSPYNKRRSPHENNRNKRYRSKSPGNRNFKPRRVSSDKDANTHSPNRSQSNRYRKGRDTRYNNGNKFNRKRSESKSDKEDETKASPQKSSQSDKEIEKEENRVDQLDETKSLSPVAEEESKTPPLPSSQTEKREKTQEELEDELLASTDDEAELDLAVDENDLDFLNMDDSESENEGRFKDKPSTNVAKKQTVLTTSKSSYGSRNFDKSKSYRGRDDRFKRRDHGSRKNSPDYRRNSPERKKSPKGEDKSMFKPTFKSVESSDKKSDDSKKSEKPSNVRSTVMKADSNLKQSEKPSSTVKSIITASDESTKSSEPRKKKILDRLGDFIVDKAKTEGTKTWSSSSKQVTKNRRHKPRRQVVLSLSAVST